MGRMLEDGEGPRVNKPDTRSQTTDDIRDTIEQQLRLPGWVRKLVEPSIRRSLRVIAEESRPPTIALYGRTGAGKSSIINALLGRREALTGEARAVTMAPDVFEYDRDGWKLRLIDSRGVGDDLGDAAFHQAVAHVVKHEIDVLLFVVPANDRAYVEEDLKFLRSLTATHKRQHETELPTILVLNKIDLVNPVDEWSPPYSFEIDQPSEDGPPGSLRRLKADNLRDCLRERLETYQPVTRLVPVCADWNEVRDRTYNVSALAQAIYEVLPESSKEGFAAVTAIFDVRQRAANDLVSRIALAAGVCALSPAGLDAFLVGCLILAMVSAIARIGLGNTLEAKSPSAFLRKLGVFGPGPLVAMFIPLLKIFGVGFIVAAVAAPGVAAVVYAIGQAAILYFIRGANLEEARQVFASETVREQARRRFDDMMQRRDAPARDAAD